MGIDFESKTTYDDDKFINTKIKTYKQFNYKLLR